MLSFLSSKSSSLSWVLLLVTALLPRLASAEIADVVAIMPNRATAYPNGLHNGMLLSAQRYNISLEIRDVGNFDPETSYKVLEEAIASEEQPKIYCIWPVDMPSKKLVSNLHAIHKVPIVQLNQLPASPWEWDHLLGYAGPDDSLRAANAGYMMVDAMKERGIEKARVVALGYPETYGGYPLSMAAFEGAIINSDIILVQSLSLDWGSQNAFNAVVHLIDEMRRTGKPVHGIYAMDDDILKGAYQAFADQDLLDEITLVGTVCNGGRSLLRDGYQYGTTVQSPFLEAVLAIDSVVQYLETGTLNETIRFTPNPTLTGKGYEDMVLEFLGETYVADNLCTWSIEHQRTNGIKDMDVTDNLCSWVECLFIPENLFVVGFSLAGINYCFAVLSAIGLWYFRNTKVMSLAQPGFLFLVIVGSVIDTTSIIFMSRDNRNYSDEQLDRSCIAWTTLLTFGQMVTTATLVAKIYRVREITKTAGKSKRGAKASRVEVRARDVSVFIIMGVAVDAALLGAWFGTDPFQWQIKAVNEDASGFILSARGECTSENPNWWAWPLSILLFHFAFLIYANILAYQTRHYHRVSDSKMVAICLFNSIQLLLVASVMLALSGDNVSISYVVRAAYAFLNNVGVLALIIGPKVYLCLTGRGNVMPVFKSSSRSSAVDQSQAVPVSQAKPEQSRKSHASASKPASGVGRTSWAGMGITQVLGDDSELGKSLQDMTESSHSPEQNEKTVKFEEPIQEKAYKQKKFEGQETCETADLEALLYPSEIKSMWESLGLPSQDHARAIVELAMKDTAFRRRQEILNGAFLRDGSKSSDKVVGYDSLVPPEEMRKKWDDLGFYEKVEAECVLEIMNHDTPADKRREICKQLFDE